MYSTPRDLVAVTSLILRFKVFLFAIFWDLQSICRYGGTSARIEMLFTTILELRLAGL
jgi:hypothetical protein